MSRIRNIIIAILITVIIGAAVVFYFYINMIQVTLSEISIMVGISANWTAVFTFVTIMTTDVFTV